MKLPRVERKVRVALDWTLDLLFTKDLVQCPTARAMPAGMAQEVVAPVLAVRAAS
jgi:NADH dehydrogenase